MGRAFRREVARRRRWEIERLYGHDTVGMEDGIEIVRWRVMIAGQPKYLFKARNWFVVPKTPRPKFLTASTPRTAWPSPHLPVKVNKQKARSSSGPSVCRPHESANNTMRRKV